MPTLVNYFGDDEFFPGGSSYANLMDSSLLSLRPHVDVYYPPRKRSRISAPFVFREEFVQQKQPSIEVLPDECLFEIFRRLPGSQEKSSCACVSKKWLMLLSSIRSEESIPVYNNSEVISEEADNQEFESDGYLTRCLEGKKATDTRLAAIAVGNGSRGGLGKLLIRGSNTIRGVSDVGLSAIARGCPSLRVLSIWNVSSIGDEGLTEIANGCHMLESLDLCQCPSISDEGLFAIANNCPNLTSLAIESCSNIGNEGMQAIGRCCPKLQSITIKDCPLVGDQGVSSLISSSSHALMKLKLQSVNITDVTLAVIGHYGRGVADLVLAGLQNVSERGFWVMGNAQGLQKLNSFAITSCRGVTDLALEAVGKGCPNLKHLLLSRCSFISDKGIVAFTKNSASLESLQLEECNRITQSGVLAAISYCGLRLKALSLVKCMGIKDIVSGLNHLSPCKSLRSLSIRDCPGFGSASLAMVGKLCPQLQHIDLSGLCGVTDDGFMPVLENNEAGLVKVNLSGCMNLTDDAVSSLARLHGGSLQLLNLGGCAKITDESLGSIAVNCELLQELDVSKCAITDFGVSALCCAKQSSLEIFSMSGCSQVSDKSMVYLSNMSRTLVGLNIQHCNSISSSAIELLVERLWRCDILS
ncbi:F-box domain [Macleaya cordata]|uniref:F-box domain n=1 Tax=Macleaya cordata TaxID=56857 RepID=A0A200QBE3_MACCD|nr:F-box domain [Macleaya cordata]